ncbi:MAG: hypothetical protein JW785_08630 [Acidimicrobiia bacterium]|nr:hypothetical protein [Acidimicrobiia bacterium]
MRNPLCFFASRFPGEGPAFLARHRACCLRCQAAAARERSLRRALPGLADEVLVAPPGLQSGVLCRLGEQDAADPRRPLVVRAAARYAAAAGLVLATGLAFAAGLARRQSRALG